MTVATDHEAQVHYTYRVNALIEHGREDLVDEVVDEARHELTGGVGGDDQELLAWRGLQRMHARLNSVINRELNSATLLSLLDYNVLAVLSEQPDQRLRASDLGRALGWETSRLSHYVDRMIERDLVTRHRDHADRRSQVVSMSPHGLWAFRAASPAHAEQLHRTFAWSLTAAQLEAIIEIAATVELTLDTSSKGCQR